jgi:crotonyl-CoA carboxylase/reductase
VAVDVSEVSKLDAEPGDLPETMAAWVIRQEREGEPKDAFQLEEIELPEPGAFEVIVRVMAAGVNYNNVWAALGGRARGHQVEAGRRGRDPLQPGLL